MDAGKQAVSELQNELVEKTGKPGDNPVVHLSITMQAKDAVAIFKMITLGSKFYNKASKNPDFKKKFGLSDEMAVRSQVFAIKLKSAIEEMMKGEDPVKMLEEFKGNIIVKSGDGKK